MAVVDRVETDADEPGEWLKSREDLGKGPSFPAPLPLLAFIFIFPLIPSPALQPAYQAVFVGVGLVGTFFALARPAAVSTEHRMEQTKILRRCVTLIVLSAVSYVLNNPTVDVGLKSSMIRGLFFVFVAFFGLYLGSMNERELRRTFRIYVYGVAFISLVAVFISLTGINFTGEKLRPSRGIGLLPSGFKTAGTPRSYGEYAIILSGGLAALMWMWKDYRPIVRWPVMAAIVLGVSVSHSRNAYLAAMLTLAVSMYPVIRKRSTKRARARIINIGCYGALVSPFLISWFLGSGARDSALGQYFVGEGVLERNAEARGDHVRVGLGALFNDPGAILRGITFERWEQLTYDTTIPHNHYVSVLIFGVPVIALLIIYLAFVKWVKVLANSNQPEAYFLGSWLAGSIFALSNYQGLFSPAMALLLGSLFSIGARTALRRYTERFTGSSTEPKTARTVPRS